MGRTVPAGPAAGPWLPAAGGSLAQLPDLQPARQPAGGAAGGQPARTRPAERDTITAR